MTLVAMLQNLLNDEAGATAIEYGLIAALIARRGSGGDGPGRNEPFFNLQHDRQQPVT